MTTVTLTEIGTSTAILLPPEVLEKLHVRSGDKLQVVETQNGVELSPYDPELEKQLAIAERVMQTDAELLKRLAE